MFCTQCGNPITAQYRFCGSCGARLAQPQPQPQPLPQRQPQSQQLPQPQPQRQPQPQPQRQPQPTVHPAVAAAAARREAAMQAQQQAAAQAQSRRASGETPYWVLRCTRQDSFFKATEMALVFFSDQLVVATLSNELHKRFIAQKDIENKATGRGFIRGGWNKVAGWMIYHQSYMRATVEEVLADDPNNLAVPYRAIQELRFEAFRQESDDDGTTTYGGKLHLTLVGQGKVKYTHRQEHEGRIQNLLFSLLGPRLVYKKR